jgi:hypothetical protein
VGHSRRQGARPAATYHDDLGYLGRIPVLPLLLMVVGVPLMATAAGWPRKPRAPRHGPARHRVTGDTRERRDYAVA